jgi:ABC-type transporter Mla subunit MlaD
MDNDEYHHIIHRLVTIMANQDRINTRVDVTYQQLAELLREHQTHLVRIDTAIERLDTVVADIKTLLARNIPLSENGRDV